MVCHETYKDLENNWLSPNEVVTEDGKNFYKKNNPREKVIVGTTESMSKSKRNTIEPENIIKIYGADAVRLFILSDSPPEKDVQWSDQGMRASYKFIQKFWLLHQEIKNKLNENQDFNQRPDELSKFTNILIDKITKNLENFHYNVIVANLYETYNFLIKEIKKDIHKDSLLKNYSKILKLMLPLMPHMISECMEEIKIKDIVEWPEIDEKFINNNDKIKIVIQINGKKRSIIEMNKDTKETEVVKEVKKNKIIKQYFSKGILAKTIYVKNRLINFIIK